MIFFESSYCINDFSYLTHLAFYWVCILRWLRYLPSINIKTNITIGERNTNKRHFEVYSKSHTYEPSSFERPEMWNVHSINIRPEWNCSLPSNCVSWVSWRILDFRTNWTYECTLGGTCSYVGDLTVHKHFFLWASRNHQERGLGGDHRDGCQGCHGLVGRQKAFSSQREVPAWHQVWGCPGPAACAVYSGGRFKVL